MADYVPPCPLCYAHFKENAGEIQVMEFSEALTQLRELSRRKPNDGIDLSFFISTRSGDHAGAETKAGLQRVHLAFRVRAGSCLAGNS
jgi:hypothetical protein